MPLSDYNMGRVISLDPGGTTGYTLAYKDGQHLYIAPCQAELDHRGILGLLIETQPNYAICEDFEYRPGVARPYIVLVSLEYIGVIKLFCGPGYSISGGHSETPLFMQKAMVAIGDKAFYNNEKLKHMGLYKRGVPHGLDSMRHLLRWFFFAYGSQFNGPHKILAGENSDFVHLVEEEWIREAYF